MACVKCKRILIDEIHYIAANLGPALLFIFEQEMAHEVATDDPLCEACFNSVTNLLESTNSSTEVMQDNGIGPSSETYDSNVCVWCLLSLISRRTHNLTSGPQRDAISNKIAPRQIPDGANVCHRCWVRACRLVDVSASDSRLSQHICVWCSHSLSQRRSHDIPHGPERDEITARITPRQIPPGGRVCYACWVSARRSVQRAANLLNNKKVCVVCSTSTVRRRTHLLLNGLERDVISRRICPRQVSNHSLVCNDCWTWARNAVRLENQQPVVKAEPNPEEPSLVLTEPNSEEPSLVLTEPNPEEPSLVLDMPHRIELKSYKKIGMSSSRCFVPGCTNLERHIVPGYLRKNVLSNYKVYIVDNARVCVVHKTNSNWDHVFNLEMLSNVFSAEEIEKMLEINNNPQTVHRNFSNTEN